MAVVVRDADIQLTIEAPKSVPSGIDGVRAVRSANDHRLTATRHTVHQIRHLRDDAALHLTVSLVSLGAMETISSMKKIAGASFSASSKTRRKLPSASPAILDTILGPLIKKKKAPVSFVTARAIKVLPLPGGPQSKAPRGGLTPKVLKSCGCLKGNSIISRI
jgi:hypothetical protein